MELSQALMEAIEPKEVEFGTNEDADNGEIKNAGSSQYTFFKDNDLYYVVGVSESGVFGFAANPSYSPNIESYSVNRLKTLSAFRVFSQVMYVLGQLVKLAPRPVYYLKFAAADHKLASLYTKMVKNQRLIREVRAMGFRYVGVMEEMGVDRYIFSRTF